MNELTYHREGDYLLPNLIPPDSQHIGAWCMRRWEYLRKHHDGIYTGLLFSGKLNAHLKEIDCSANEMFDLLLAQYVAREGVTKQLKVRDQMEWVRRMNGIKNRVTDVVFNALIYY